ncbi:FAD-dependent monooxygenase [Streptomyces caniscabiei]|uniref:FAD-dependent monooxygenase n=1 Tax=Streptomyces caniscabiei TaxID=2746961 RepID=A0ABU4MW41_9ACTN|nr:FAD-dependent monooxygenase [Streptomyces caniscabiei]MBE4737599.1 FAD-dependent monooxygenase [Streptomyces caniscabiei]MBE4756359.1 FAD-dependent monooxygenase [Streptomyces caniscabiei]MBE4769625.1 FAD-dependent monooxygenase [Streptomyces caniscabiei]MBE4787430.1 FAD-dependent monooxygenase [Streptomyces caniscabiei]MBE4795165.1 FAD-dependent monooxygenase [Streptomyces caniscabiei]
MTSSSLPPQGPRRALVVGSGISGLAAALSLHRAGWKPLIIERTPERRTGGYFVRFNGPGYTAAERLGILDSLPDRRDPEGRMFEVDSRGRLTPGLTFPEQANGTPLRMLLRSDLERVLYEAVQDLVEIRYGTGPAAITQDRDQVTVTLTDGSVESADLLIGADGIHSTVRSLAFGPEDLYRKDFDHVVAACVMDGPLPGMRDGDCAVATAPGRSAWINSYRDHPPVAFLLYRTDWPSAEIRKKPSVALRQAFADFGGDLVPVMLEAMDRSESVLFDQVSQIHLNRWSQGRVVLLGDSAWCMTLHSGQGSGMGIAGAELLARLLTEHGDLPTALGSWEQQLRPFVTRYQKEALLMRHFFMPANRFGRLARSTLIRAVSTPVGARLGKALMG